MLISWWALALTALFVLGVCWCCEVIRRLKDDLQELREIKEAPRKAGIIIVWIITIVIAVVLIISTVVIIGRLTRFVLSL